MKLITELNEEIKFILHNLYFKVLNPLKNPYLQPELGVPCMIPN